MTNTKSNFSLKLNIFKSKTFKILIGILLAVLVVLLGAYKTISIIKSPDKVTAAFKEAIQTEDAKKLQKILCTSDSNLNIDIELVEELIKSFKNNDLDLNVVNASLNEDLFNIEALVTENSTSLLNNNEFFAITVSKKGILFDTYGILVRPVYLDISTNSYNSTITCNGKELGKMANDDDTSKISPVLPGNLEIVATTKNSINVEIVDKQTISTSYFKDYDAKYDSEYNLSFFEDYSCYDITSNVPVATIYINGTSTEKTVKNAGTKFGPLSDDDEIYLLYTANDVEYKTNTTTPGDSWYYDTLNLDFSASDYKAISRYVDLTVDNENNTHDDKESDEILDTAQQYIDKYKKKDYIIPSSNTEELNFKALNSYTYEELFIARNEIYARHGYIFKDKPILQKYFESKSWYTADESFNGELTSDTDRLNEGYIKTVEFLKMAYEEDSAIYSDYVFKNSDIEELTASDVRYLSDWELVIARNEIYARYGLEFSTEELITYFKSKKWFVIDKSVGNDVALNAVENKNITTILNEEKNRMTSTLNHDLGEYYE